MLKKLCDFTKYFCLITTPSIIIFILFLEFIVFRFILPASEVPYRYSIVSSDDIVRFAYGNYGMYRNGIYRKGFPCEIKARYHVNSEGWNANREYFEQKSGKKRIAIIGDSYVEALQVDVDKSLAEVLERDLSKNREKNIEVYRFGIGYAPLSQYLQMMRYIKKRYQPDIIIVVINHTDFLESIHDFGNLKSDFLQFAKKDEEWVEVKPRPYAYIPDSKRVLLKRSAIRRYFYLNLNLEEAIAFLINRFKNEHIEMNVKRDEVIENLDMIRSLCYHIFYCFKEVLDTNTKLLLVMDGNRTAIYEGRDPKTEKLYALNTIASDMARESLIPFVDLNDVFILDYKNNGQPFDFKCDKHWNERGHFLVGKTISAFIQKHGWCRVD